MEERVKLSGAGEPGIYFNNDKDWGTNPCCEIALRPYQFCNLCEVNVSQQLNHKMILMIELKVLLLLEHFKPDILTSTI